MAASGGAATAKAALGAPDEAEGNGLSPISLPYDVITMAAYWLEEVEAALGIPPFDLDAEEVGPIMLVVLASAKSASNFTSRERRDREDLLSPCSIRKLGEVAKTCCSLVVFTKLTM